MSQRFLTQREAERCEMAQEPACKCRCEGAKHGAGRIGKGGDFSLLPEDDPHYRPSMNKKQIIKFLGDAYYAVVRDSNFPDYHSTGYKARHDALVILTDARESVRGGTR